MDGIVCISVQNRRIIYINIMQQANWDISPVILPIYSTAIGEYSCTYAAWTTAGHQEIIFDTLNIGQTRPSVAPLMKWGDKSVVLLSRARRIAITVSYSLGWPYILRPSLTGQRELDDGLSCDSRSSQKPMS